MKYKGIIFDFFGTLTNQNCAPEDKIIEEWKLYQRENFSYKEIENVVCGTACPTPFSGRDRLNYYHNLVDELVLPNFRPTYEKLDEITKSDINGEKLVDGALEILDYARKNCLKLGMISDLPNPDYDLSTVWGFADKFDFRHLSYDPEWITNGNYDRPLKPDLGVFLRVLDKLDVRPNETIMIGNSFNSDIKPARKLGMRAVLVDYHEKYCDSDKVQNLQELKNIL